MAALGLGWAWLRGMTLNEIQDALRHLGGRLSRREVSDTGEHMALVGPGKKRFFAF